MSDNEESPEPTKPTSSRDKKDSKKKRTQIEWAKDPTLDKRLLDWLDANPKEKNTLLLGTPGSGLSRVARITGNYKINCCMSIVSEVFVTDKNPDIREMARSNPSRLAHSIMSRVSYLQGLYKNFIDVAGPEIANMTAQNIEDMELDEDSMVALEMRAFPLWKRLHGCWRTLSHLNRFYYALKVEHDATGKVPRTYNKRKKPEPRSLLSEGTEDSSGDDKGQSESAIEKKQREHSLPVIVSTSSGSIRPRKRNRFKSEEDDTASRVEGHSVSMASTESQQEHEIRMEELRLKRKELESAEKEKERVAELRRLEIEERLQAELIKERQRVAEDNRIREKGKQELIAKLMTLITGLDGEGPIKLPEINRL